MKKLYKIDQERDKKEKIKSEMIKKYKEEGQENFDNIDDEVEQEFQKLSPVKEGSAKKYKHK